MLPQPYFGQTWEFLWEVWIFFVRTIALISCGLLRSWTSLALENLALRQQLAVLRRSVKRPHFRPRDRLFWVILRRVCKDWRSYLILVKPETVVSK